MSGRGVRRFVADLLRRRRPRPFRAEPEDAAELRAALMLRAAAPGAATPADSFVDELHQRLRAALGDPEPARPSRRRIMARTAAVAAASAAAGAATHAALSGDGSGPAAHQPPAETVLPNSGTWQPVAASGELPEGGVRQFEFGTIVGFVQRVGGELRAVSGVCTHLGCRLSLDAAAGRLACPCHRTTFATTGEVLSQQLPVNLAPLPAIPVRETAGTVQIFVPTPT